MTLAQFADAGKMPEPEYDRRREALRATYGDTATERTGLFDQELARLFYQSNWSQEKLAAKEHKSQSWIDYRSRFGRFLSFTTAVVIPKNLTEWKFRSFWDRTDKAEPNERIRFNQVARLMEEEATYSKSRLPKKAIADAIKSTCGNSGWHRLATIISKVQAVVKEATDEEVKAVVVGMANEGTWNVFCEKKKGSHIYRIVLGGNKKIDLVVLQQELGPIIAGLKAEGRKNMATMSPGTVAHLTFELERLIDKLAHLMPNEGKGTDNGTSDIPTHEGGGS